ncbi:hypothetical protein ScPMuIL_016293 [Solemya velum]
MAIPTHHKRQEICATRPAYREGRRDKAVKVYTVSQESQYLLIQGVPAVGATDELVKLCALYGPVQEYRALDDYPAEKFSEVYLIKYQRIQSARFAKRQLDDQSFFGGVLHVCYAPEYESVQETREKIHERMRTVAIKIRQHAANDKHADMEQEESILSETESCFEKGVSEGENSGSQFEQQTFPERDYQFPVVPYAEMEDRVSMEQIQLPPPPQQTFSSNHYRPFAQPLDFARVPTAHATLPTNYDGRLSHTDNSKNDPKVEPQNNGSAIISETSKHRGGEDRSRKLEHGNNKKGGVKLKKTDEIIIRKFQKDGPTPRFIPRQTIQTIKSKTSQEKSPEDPLDKEIKKNALTLGETQGPQCSAGEQPVVSSESERSIENTTRDLRKRIWKFSSDPVVSKTKRPKMS